MSHSMEDTATEEESSCSAWQSADTSKLQSRLFTHKQTFKVWSLFMFKGVWIFYMTTCLAARMKGLATLAEDLPAFPTKSRVSRSFYQLNELVFQCSQITSHISSLSLQATNSILCVIGPGKPVQVLLHCRLAGGVNLFCPSNTWREQKITRSQSCWSNSNFLQFEVLQSMLLGSLTTFRSLNRFCCKLNLRTNERRMLGLS